MISSTEPPKQGQALTEELPPTVRLHTILIKLHANGKFPNQNETRWLCRLEHAVDGKPAGKFGSDTPSLFIDKVTQLIRRICSSSPGLPDGPAPKHEPPRKILPDRNS